VETSGHKEPAGGTVNGLTSSRRMCEYQLERNRADCVSSLEYIISTLPNSILETTPSSSLANSPLLLSIYSHLPYSLFKYVTESSDFALPDTQSRFSFAKRCIAHRKKLGISPAGMEEGVVLAVGGTSGEVNIIRKPKRGARAPLWKVEG
jgi:hypothetical protein